MLILDDAAGSSLGLSLCIIHGVHRFEHYLFRIPLVGHISQGYRFLFNLFSDVCWIFVLPLQLSKFLSGNPRVSHRGNITSVCLKVLIRELVLNIGRQAFLRVLTTMGECQQSP